MVGNVLFSAVDVTPAIDPADLPSIGNLKRTRFSAGCSTILTMADGFLEALGCMFTGFVVWRFPKDGAIRDCTYWGTPGAMPLLLGNDVRAKINNNIFRFHNMN